MYMVQFFVHGTVGKELGGEAGESVWVRLCYGGPWLAAGAAALQDSVGKASG